VTAKGNRVGPPLSTVQSIRRAFDVLGALSEGPIGVTEVAARVALPKSTAARLLASLAGEAVVERIPGETRWRLGPRIVTLAGSVRPTRSLVALAHPHLVELSASVGEAAGLSVPEGMTAHYVDQVDSPHPVGVRDWTGTRLPIHAVSSGHVFLAHMPPGQLKRVLDAPLERFTERTCVDPVDLRERLRHVQLDGVAWTVEEFSEGIASVAAPVVDAEGAVIAALHVHGPSYRFPPSGAEATVGDAVRATAARLSARIRDAASSLPG